ncbi:MAG: hypothetical protein JWO86_1622 [Myxococcaceae bacterium]|nr:hypothetical protein [Myxococcaceae bacterium]MEA2752206.1 hypothetical protein [Myxococcales bacterium]
MEQSHRHQGSGSLFADIATFAAALLIGCSSNDSAPAAAPPTNPPSDVVAMDAGGSDAVPVLDAATPDAADAAAPYRPKMADLIGANGWPYTDNNMTAWQTMGLGWGRNEVGPGQPTSASDPMDVSKTTGGADLGSIILKNNASGVRTLILLAYTASWNALLPGDSHSAPVDVVPWQNYVEAAVKRYSAAPYNVKHFQIWNEAAGTLAGGSPQATFWHGPGPSNAPYANAMTDYVDRIHIPAAKIIRSYNAYVVYGGWPDQGGLDTYSTWLEYMSVTHGARMLDWVDYLDLHYLGVDDEQTLYSRYMSSGKIRGIWQTEIGDGYMVNQNYLPQYYFDSAIWALGHGWDDRNKYVSLIYHWEGTEAFRLTARDGTYNPSGRSLVTLHTTLPGFLAPFEHALTVSAGLTAKALYSDDKIVLQVVGKQGAHSVGVADVAAPASGHSKVEYIDGVEGTPVPAANLVSSWVGKTLSVQFSVPGPKNDVQGTPRDHLGYVVVTPLP